MATHHGTAALVSSPLSNGEIRRRMAKATLPKGENIAFRAELRLIGDALNGARNELGWTIDQLARELDKDEKQVSRWLRGEERTQVDVVFSVPALRQPFVVHLALRAGCRVRTTITMARRRVA